MLSPYWLFPPFVVAFRNINIETLQPKLSHGRVSKTEASEKRDNGRKEEKKQETKKPNEEII